MFEGILKIERWPIWIFLGFHLWAWKNRFDILKFTIPNGYETEFFSDFDFRFETWV